MIVSTNTDVEVDICEIWSLLLSADTVFEFSLPGLSFVYVGGPDANSSAVHWNVGWCRCQNTGQESPSCLVGEYLDSAAWTVSTDLCC
jgi:hypothetical protein